MFQLFFLSAGSILFTFVGLIAYIYFIDDDLAPHWKVGYTASTEANFWMGRVLQEAQF